MGEHAAEHRLDNDAVFSNQNGVARWRCRNEIPILQESLPLILSARYPQNCRRAATITLMPVDLSALTQYDTPTICNTIELFGVRPRNQGYMDGRIRACFPEMPPIAGYAATASMRCDQ